MLSFRKLAIFGFLFAAVLVSTSSGDERLVRRFRLFIAKIKDIESNGSPGETFPYQTDILHELDDDFKEGCVGHDGCVLQCEPLGILNTQCSVFVNVTQYYLEVDRESHPDDYHFGWQFEWMWEHGYIIQFLVFKNRVSQNKMEMKNEINRLRKIKEYKRMSDEEAELWVILHKYDWGIIGDRYPGERPTTGSKTVITSRPYKTIDERFDEFVDSVKREYDSYPRPNDTYEYQIDILNQVDNPLKLRCLKGIEDRLRADKMMEAMKSFPGVKYDKRNIQNDAYKILDQACKKYVKELKWCYKAPDVKWQFDRMLKQGNIIQFLVYKNKVSQNKTEMETEFIRLRKIYDEDDLGDREAKLWVILHKYDWEILGDRYPGERPTSAGSKTVITTKNPYKTIGERFGVFLALVKEEDRKTRQSGTSKYTGINHLDEVEGGLKLRFLEEFETGSLPQHIRRNTPEHAYRALDGACNMYVNDIKNTLNYRILINDEIEELLESIKGNIIQFSIDKKNLQHNIKKMEMKTEIKRLKEIYKRKEITTEEVPFWMNLDNYKRKILGEYKPVSNAESEPKPGCIPRFF